MGAAFDELHRLIEPLIPKDNDGKFANILDRSSKAILCIAKLLFARLREFARANTRTCSRLIESAQIQIQLSKIKFSSKKTFFITSRLIFASCFYSYLNASIG